MRIAPGCIALVMVAMTLLPSSGCRVGVRDAAADDKSPSSAVTVEVLAATRTADNRTTTQPATVHAYYESRVFAKVAGYLAELKADIGQSVKAGEELAVIGIPEMSKQREAKLALIRQLEADERRATSQVAVTRASINSYAAKLDRAKADVAKTVATLTAVRVELSRVTDLVNQHAVADRLEDEARNRYAAAAAEKTAAEAAVASAEAEVMLAKAESDAVLADLDVAKATTDVARRQLEELDELIKYARLTAPFDGMVTQRHIDPGDLVRNAQTGSSQSGSPLFVVAKVDRVRVRVAVPERDVALATVGDATRITLQAFPGEEFGGTIARVSGALDEETRTMLVEIDLPNPDHRLRPGMFGQATITLAPPRDTLSLPAGAVRYDTDGNSYVYVVNDSNQIDIVTVKTGRDNGTEIEITAGLKGGERIVGPVLRRLRPGQKVVVKK